MASAASLSRDEACADQRRIIEFRLVVHDDRDDNHWTLLLMLEDGINVQVNMRMTGPDDQRGVLYWRQLTYVLSHSEVAHWRLILGSNWTVAHVAHSIYSRGRDRFLFSGGGSGCRYWTWTIINDLSAISMLHADSGNFAWNLLQYHYGPGKKPSRQNWVEGVFY